jgi:hypothetical protein
LRAFSPTKWSGEEHAIASAVKLMSPLEMSENGMHPSRV